MLDFGFSEILLTSAIALVVLGPERLPKVARQVGNWMGRARSMARQLTEQLEREVNAEELLREQNKYKVPVAPQIAAPQPVTLDPYAHLPAHDPIPPRSPLPPDVVAASAAVDSAPPPAAQVTSMASTEAPVLIAVAPVDDASTHATNTVVPAAEPSATAGAHSAHPVTPLHE
jgi:sec-independent protein translocase protein TatB